MVHLCRVKTLLRSINEPTLVMMMAKRTACRDMFVLLAGFTVLLSGLPRGNAELPISHSMNFIGVGYDIIMGNPEGDSQDLGGADPGLHASRKIFELTYDQGKESKDNKYRVPDEVEFVQRSNIFTTKEKSVYSGTKSYANSLSRLVEESASLDAVFASVKFAGSHDYKKIAKNQEGDGYVYFTEETVENLGNIRYKSELARADGYNFTRDFYASVCALPANYETNERKYMEFIDRWGTHVVKELDAGIRSGESNRTTMSSFVKEASQQNSDSLSLAGRYKVASASVSVDIGKFHADEGSQERFESELTYFRTGSLSLQEPINLKLLGLNELLADDRYWTSQKFYDATLCPVGWDRPLIASNILKAYTGYIEYKKVNAAEDSKVRIPLTWPDGQYALLKPARNGGTCPNTDYLVWDEGNRLQKMEQYSANWWEETQHFTNEISEESVKLFYCVKTFEKASPSDASWDWMPGSYCIYQYGANCPRGFDSGYIKYDDEDTNKNNYQGTLPAGEYTQTYTLNRFCCRNDASPMYPIYLPTDTSFYLVRYFQTCQKVQGMTVQDEYLEFDTVFDFETGKRNEDEAFGAYPHPGTTSTTRIKITFCYYEPETPAKREDGSVASLREEVLETFLHLLRKDGNDREGLPA